MLVNLLLVSLSPLTLVNGLFQITYQNQNCTGKVLQTVSNFRMVPTDIEKCKSQFPQKCEKSLISICDNPEKPLEPKQYMKQPYVSFEYFSWVDKNCKNGNLLFTGAYIADGTCIPLYNSSVKFDCSNGIPVKTECQDTMCAKGCKTVTATDCSDSNRYTCFNRNVTTPHNQTCAETHGKKIGTTSTETHGKNIGTTSTSGSSELTAHGATYGTFVAYAATVMLFAFA